MDQSEANDYAARGAALLDRECNGWLAMINLARLYMADERLCILGQAYAEEASPDCDCCEPNGYSWGMHELGNPGNEYGFNGAFATLALLDTAWKALITARRFAVVQQLSAAGWRLSRDSLTMLSPTGETHEISADIAPRVF